METARRLLLTAVLSLIAPGSSVQVRLIDMWADGQGGGEAGGRAGGAGQAGRGAESRQADRHNLVMKSS